MGGSFLAESNDEMKLATEFLSLKTKQKKLINNEGIQFFKTEPVKLTGQYLLIWNISCRPSELVIGTLGLTPVERTQIFFFPSIPASLTE